MGNHEGVTNQQASTEWDALLPENNGLGEFYERTAEVNSDNVIENRNEDAQIEEQSEKATAEGIQRSEGLANQSSTKLNQTKENIAGLEVEPILIDSHNIDRAWDPDATDAMTRNILDDWWTPDLDDSRPDEITIEQRFDELRTRQQFLDSLEDYLRNPNLDDKWKFTDIDQTVENFRNTYLEQLERKKQNPDEPSIDVAVKNAHNCLVEVRTYQYLASDPEARRKEIAYEKAGLGQVLAARDERYKDAFSEVDTQQIKDRLDKILDQIPQREYDNLARMMGEDGALDNKFIAKTNKVVTKALGLKGKQLEFDTFDEPDSTTYGNCRDLGGGRSLIKLNKAKVKDASQYANTAAHEIFHAKQHQIKYTQRDKESGKFYEFCSSYYIPPEFDYNKYVSQYTEAEAFYFGNEFSRKIDEAKAALPQKKRPFDKLRNSIRRK